MIRFELSAQAGVELQTWLKSLEGAQASVNGVSYQVGTVHHDGLLAYSPQGVPAPIPWSSIDELKVLKASPGRRQPTELEELVLRIAKAEPFGHYHGPMGSCMACDIEAAAKRIKAACTG